MLLVFVLIGLVLCYKAGCAETDTNKKNQEHCIIVSKIVDTIENINNAQSATLYASQKLEETIKKSNDLIVRCRTARLENLSLVELKSLDLIEFISKTCAMTKEYKDIHVKSFEYMLKHTKEMVFTRLTKLRKLKRCNTLETTIIGSIEKMVNENADMFIDQDDCKKLEDIISQTVHLQAKSDKRSSGLIKTTQKSNGRFVLTY